MNYDKRDPLERFFLVQPQWFMSLQPEACKFEMRHHSTSMKFKSTLIKTLHFFVYVKNAPPYQVLIIDP